MRFKLSNKRIPSLGLDRNFTAVARDHSRAKFRFGDVSDHPYSVDGLDLLLVGERHCEEKFVVLATVHSRSHKIHIEFLSHDSCLIIDGDSVFVYTTADIRCLAYMQQFG